MVSRFCLEFNCEHGRIIGHKREGRIAACTVEHGRNNTSMHETVMLCVRCGVGHHQFDFSGLKARNCYAERFHYLLLIKAGLDA